MQHEPEQLRRAYLSFLDYMSGSLCRRWRVLRSRRLSCCARYMDRKWIAAALPLRITEHRKITNRSARGNGRRLLRAWHGRCSTCTCHGVRFALIVDRGDGHRVERIALGLRGRDCGRSRVQRRRAVGRVPHAGRRPRESNARFDFPVSPPRQVARRPPLAGRVLAANLGASGLVELLMMIALLALRSSESKLAQFAKMLGGAMTSVSIGDRLANPSEGPCLHGANIDHRLHLLCPRDGDAVKRQAEALTSRGDQVDANLPRRWRSRRYSRSQRHRTAAAALSWREQD